MNQIREPGYGADFETNRGDERENIYAQLNLTRNEKEKNTQLIKEEKKKHKEKIWKMIFFSQLGIAFITAVIVAIILYIINAPITQTHNHDMFTKESQNWVVVLIIAFIAFVIVFTAPFVIKLITKVKKRSK